MPRSIAVIVATYGDLDRWDPLAKRALESVKAQTRAPEEVIRCHGTTLAAARNAGAAQATTELVTFLDADDLYHEGYIAAMAEADPALDVVQPAVQHQLGRGNWTAPSVWDPNPLILGNYLHIGCAVRRSLFSECSGFDDYEALEDWALWLKLELAGATFGPCASAIYRVVGSGAPGRNSDTLAVQRATSAIQERFGAIARGAAPAAEQVSAPMYYDPRYSTRRVEVAPRATRGVIAYVGNFEPRHSTETHIARTLEEDLGWEVLRLQENQFSTDQVLDRALRANARLFLYTRTWGFVRGGDGNQLLRDLAAHGIPTASYHLDLYFGIERQNTIVGDPFWGTKYVFTADGGHEDEFLLAGIRHQWIPPGVFRPECYLAQPDERFRADVAFVGALDEYHKEWLPYRQKLKRHLVKWYGERFRYWPQPGEPAVRNEDLNALYASVKVCVGDSLCPGFNSPRYWSDRLTESVGRGGFIIHPYIEGLWEDGWVEGQTLVTYPFDDFDALKAKIDFYLANEAERLRIRDAGHEFVKANLTYTNRLRFMLAHVAKAEGWTDFVP